MPLRKTSAAYAKRVRSDSPPVTLIAIVIDEGVVLAKCAANFQDWCK